MSRRNRRPSAGLGVVFVLGGLSGCLASPGLSPAPAPAPALDVGLQNEERAADSPVRRLLATAMTATASSSASGFGPARAIDGNLASEWASGVARAAEASLTLDLGATQALANLKLKMRPQRGNGSYRIEVSETGSSYTAVAGSFKNTSWNLETKTLPAGTQGRYVRLRFLNDQAMPDDRFSVFEVQIAGGATTPTPTPAPTPVPTPPPAGATPPPATGSVPVVLPANPGANAARGRALVNGRGVAGIKVEIQGNGKTYLLTTDATGTFTATGLTAGSYVAYYYNDSDRNKIGYWRSRAFPVDGTKGAAFPQVDLYQVGMTNLPKMDARVGRPTTFSWVRQTQPIQSCMWRLHDRPFRSFTLVYQSAKLPGDASSFTFSGSGLNLSTTNRYFWGYQWDAGPVGMGGNLYQAVYFNQ